MLTLCNFYAVDLLRSFYEVVPGLDLLLGTNIPMIDKLTLYLRVLSADNICKQFGSRSVADVIHERFFSKNVIHERFF